MQTAAPPSDSTQDLAATVDELFGASAPTPQTAQPGPADELDVTVDQILAAQTAAQPAARNTAAAPPFASTEDLDAILDQMLAIQSTPPQAVRAPSLTPQQTALSVLYPHWDRALPVRVERLALAVGARVVVRGGSLDAGFRCLGRLVRGGTMPLIEVNTHESVLTRRFIAAHELGHLMLDHQGCAPDDGPSFDECATSAVDRDANAFAAALLMPPEAVRETHAQGLSLAQLAELFAVPVSIMRRRLDELGL